MQPRPPATNPQKEEKVIGYVTFPYKGAAFALQKRAEQLNNTTYAVKQYIHTLREASQVSIDGHKKARELFILPSLYFADPTPSLSDSSTIKDTTPTKDSADLFCKDGLKSLLDQHTIHHDETAEAIGTGLNDPVIALHGVVEELDEQKAQINILLGKDRLGKSHHHQEETVCAAKSELNKTISSLSKTCCTGYSPPTAYLNPHTICRDAKYRMKEYLKMEHDYQTRCLQEQAALKLLENEIFTTLQRIPLEQEKIMSPLMDKCIEIMAEVEPKTVGFHALTDWTAFESKHAGELAREEEVRPITFTEKDHQHDSQFLEFRVLQLDNLHIYHNLRKNSPKAKPKSDESLGIKLKRAVTLTRHDYAPRGTWTISMGGHLIEYDHKAHAVLSIFNLRKCKLGALSQMDPVSNKKSSTYCYITLHGQKVHEPSERKKHRRKKEYRFRAPWGIAQIVYQELTKYCLLAEEKGSEKVEKKAGVQQQAEQEMEQETSSEDTVAGTDPGDMAVYSYTPPTVEV